MVGIRAAHELDPGGQFDRIEPVVEKVPRRLGFRLLSSLTSRAGLLNRAVAGIFRSQSASRALYPFLRAGRGAGPHLLGRSTIAIPGQR